MRRSKRRVKRRLAASFLILVVLNGFLFAKMLAQLSPVPVRLKLT